MRTGVDRAGAIAPWEAKALHDAFGFTWCGVYIGGPTNGGYGWTEAVCEALGPWFDFLPIYVGANLPWTPNRLTAAYGKIDGQDAARIMKSFGWQPGHNLPVALDVEYDTPAGNPSGTRDYMVAWCNAVAAAGYFPVIYAPPFALNEYAAVAQTPTGAWITKWISSQKIDPDPRQHLATRFTGYAMQYTGGTWLAGMKTDFDLNTSTDDFKLAPAPSRVADMEIVKEEEKTVFFEETGHGIGGGFLQYWRKYGGLKIFGYPITDEAPMTGADGKTFTVQYFERARFEHHPDVPELAEDWHVQLGLVGRETYDHQNPSRD